MVRRHPENREMFLSYWEKKFRWKERKQKMKKLREEKKEKEPVFIDVAVFPLVPEG